MPNVVIHRRADPSLRRAVSRLADASERVDGFRFLSDHLWLDLHDDGDEFVAAAVREDDELVAYAQASPANRGVIVESSVLPTRRGVASLEPTVLVALFDEVARSVPPPASSLSPDAAHIPVTWWAHDVQDRHHRIAADLGLEPVRNLLQMRRPLPTGMPVTVETRDFVVGQDEVAWLEVNNRAFAAHGEQGGWDLPTLRQREAEPWFSPEGFRLHERDGRLAAFCWTKIHDEEQPPAGEIYVIGVDPDFQGLGLGRELTLAGLESIVQRGVTTGMLYVDGDNTAAVGLYHALGFSISRTDRAYTVMLNRKDTT